MQTILVNGIPRVNEDLTIRRMKNTPGSAAEIVDASLPIGWITLTVKTAPSTNTRSDVMREITRNTRAGDLAEELMLEDLSPKG
jgi:hypothetical protein